MVHWPGDPAFHIERALDQEKGDPATVSQMSLGAHTGTHMDAPLHFFRNATPIDRIPLDTAVGPARILQIDDPKSIRREDLLKFDISEGERILFKTRNSEGAWNTDRFEENFVFISQDAARYLAECRIRCVGVDYLSVGGFHEDGPETHHALLGAGIWIIEGLNLHGLAPGAYELACLPLRLMDAEGAPARAILRRIE